MILLIGGEKGGTGKSTIATNLACYIAEKKKDVMLLDCDPQCTSSRWVNRRSKNHPSLPSIHCTQKTDDIYDAAVDLSKRYEHVIIDAGGRDSEELRTAMAAAHLMYIPLKASQPDIETSKHMSQLVKMAKAINRGLQARLIISMASSNPIISEDREAISLLSEIPNLGISGVTIRERKIYRDAMIEGKGVLECSNYKAKNEIKLLGQEIYNV